ncbi:phospholipid/glycerol acyltransferase [Gloeothece citriformis PCC 7424]|uniref:Phospholipid/glycerol acyltransferase n=1 Tax=Gloeothece citriformis (strain PCC 7424) TaxID=65393 RepID=B7KF97_GLOC7|nr:lysophospholipid acyltransferase family protein [Gloeothece citriformis]ACK71813.1 phospholipid/glycerol acyltransferase [Gloeothece citriformis PCC 7424]
MNHRPGWSLEQRDPQFINSLLPHWSWIYHYYFCVKTDGWEHIPKEKVLLVGSHNGGLAAPDMFMVLYDWVSRFGTDRLVYGLMHPKVWLVSPQVGRSMEKLGAIAAHPKMAMAAFKKGASVLVYPGGAQDVFRPHFQRNKIYFAERRGFIKLALRAEVPIIPVISHGAHDTLWVIGDCYQQVKQLHDWGMPWLLNIDPEVFPIYLGLPWGIGIGPLPNIPLPMPIYTRVCPPIIFEKYGQKISKDHEYVEACYHQVVTKMQQELDHLDEEIEKTKVG